jgi:hypothetical protein
MLAVIVASIAILAVSSSPEPFANLTCGLSPFNPSSSVGAHPPIRISLHFAQSQSRWRKASHAYGIPLCRPHHRQNHEVGETKWPGGKHLSSTRFRWRRGCGGSVGGLSTGPALNSDRAVF